MSCLHNNFIIWWLLDSSSSSFNHNYWSNLICIHKGINCWFQLHNFDLLSCYWFGIIVFSPFPFYNASTTLPLCSKILTKLKRINAWGIRHQIKTEPRYSLQSYCGNWGTQGVIWNLYIIFPLGIKWEAPYLLSKLTICARLKKIKRD